MILGAPRLPQRKNTLSRPNERAGRKLHGAGQGRLKCDCERALSEALEELRQDELVQSALGPIAEEFIAMKANEWAEYDSQVSRWEVDQYLTSL